MSTHELLAAPDLHPSAPDAVPTAPGVIGGVAMSHVEVVRRDFNRGLFDREDPLEGAGEMLSDFGFADIYAVDMRRQKDLIGKLHANVLAHSRNGRIPGATIQVVEYNDVRTGSREPPRRFVRLEAESLRSTHMSLFARFLPFGDHLYVAVSCFILPPLSLWRFIRALFVSGIVFLLINLFLPFLGFFVAIGVLVWHYRDVVRALSQGESLSLALRQHFNKANDLGTFNTDDVLMFFKSAVPIVLTSIHEVFAEAGIPVDVLERAIQNISFVTNVSTGGGAFNAINSAVGGSNNSVVAVAARVARG